MAVSHALASIGRFIWRTPPPPVDLLEAYAHEVIPVLDRAEWLYEYWLEQSTLFTDSEKLGNVAAIHRWETATMGRSLERVIPPAVLAGAHESVIDALEMASRAAQLLSNGSRFHNANAVCEGQAMLMASRERRLSALKSMRRYLSRIPPPEAPEIEIPTEPAALPESEAASEPGTVSASDVANQSTAAPSEAGSEPVVSSSETLDDPSAALTGAKGEASTHLPEPDGADDVSDDLDADPPLAVVADAPLPDFLNQTSEPVQTSEAVEASESERRPESPPPAAPSASAAPTDDVPPPADPDKAPARSGWGTLFGR